MNKNTEVNKLPSPKPHKYSVVGFYHRVYLKRPQKRLGNIHFGVFLGRGEVFKLFQLLFAVSTWKKLLIMETADSKTQKSA